MTLTIAQALKQLPVLSKAVVVAGSQGLDRPIRWTHIIDHPDVIPWVKEGHLLLTTAFALMLHPEEQADLIHALDAKHLAGMLVNTGRYMLEIPPAMTSAAEECGFPLIALPWEVDFTEVTYAIHEHILQEQYALAEQADNIHQALTRLVVEGGDLAALTRQMADILGCSVTIEDESLRLLAHTTLEPTDEVRRRSIELGRTPPEVVEYLRRQGVFEQLRSSPKPYHLPPHPAVGFQLERIVSPILVGEQLFGYIWIIASDHPLTSLDSLVIERGAVVAALILSRQEAIYESEQRLKARTFERSIDPGSSATADSLLEGGWASQLQGGYTLLVIETGNPTRHAMRQLASLVEDHMQAEGWWTTAIERGRHLAVLVASLESGALRESAERFARSAREKGLPARVGISSPSRQPEAVRRSYQQALDALEAASALGQEQPVHSYDDLGFLATLLKRPGGEPAENRYTSLLEQIGKHDREKHTHYLATLEIYLDHPNRPNQAARLLFIHRNTLYQRLEKITELWGIDFEDPLTVLNITLALKSNQLSGSK